MATKYLGYGYTNRKGIALLEKDPNDNPLTYSYTGVGAGEIDIIAKSGTIESELLTINDYLFVDNAILSNYNSNWQNYNNRITVSRDTLGTLLENPSSNNGYFTAVTDTLTSFAIEFDIISITGASYISYDSAISRIRIDTRASDGDTVRIEYKDGTSTIYVNGEEIAELTTTTYSYIAFMLVGATLKFSNFKILSFF